MTRHLRAAIVAFVLAAGATAVHADQRVRPPQFESDYELPATSAPAARSDLADYIDLAVLVGAILLASYIALKTRRRRGLLVALWIGELRNCASPGRGPSQQTIDFPAAAGTKKDPGSGIMIPRESFLAS